MLRFVFGSLLSMMLLVNIAYSADAAVSEKAGEAAATTSESTSEPATEPAAESTPEPVATAPKHFKTTLGGLEVIAMLDAQHDGKAELLIDMTQEDKDRAAKPGALAMTVNAFVVKMNGKTILFDSGLGKSKGGDVMSALTEAGVKPEDIDAILITHFHFDHVGGLLDAGKPVFPRAELYLPRLELDKWGESGIAFVAAYGARASVFEHGAEVVLGVKAMDATGHTPGHTVYMLESNGGKLLIAGDLIHLAGVQLANPNVAFQYDSDPVRAVAMRKKYFTKAAEEKLPIASMHMPFPGIGTLTKDGVGYSFNEIR